MNVCMWSGSSFEQPYASYHLIEGMLNALLDAGHSVWLVQMQRSTGAMPASLIGRQNLHVVHIPWEDAEKTAFAKRFLRSIQYYKRCEREIRKLQELNVVLGVS